MVEFGLRMRQSEPIYKTLKYIQANDVWKTLTPVQQRIVDQRILATELSGIGLKGGAAAVQATSRRSSRGSRRSSRTTSSTRRKLGRSS